ncbi:MAG: OmpA family protein [Niabella sp.]
MKKIITLVVVALTCTLAHGQIFNKVKNKVQEKINQRIDQKTDQTIDKSIDKTESTIDKIINKVGNVAKGEKKTEEEVEVSDIAYENNAIASPTATKPTFKSYQNYDFIAGDSILFADNFLDDEDGEFPSHWKLGQGQGVLNTVEDVPAFSLTEGNYAEVSPRMKTADYLNKEFTIEFDYYPLNTGYISNTLIVFFKYVRADGQKLTAQIHFRHDGSIEVNHLPQSKQFSAKHPTDNKASFPDKWHHAALSYKNGQLKCYIDQYRVLTIPDLGIEPLEFGFGGRAYTGQTNLKDALILFSNVRAAKGSKAKTIGKEFTDTKIVTHGITFDFGKAVIKPESMGTLNMIVKILNNNPKLQFEIGGHASKTGSSTNAAAFNQTLSEQRAEAVRTQLISMGIDASRLTTKGYGETQPIADNATPEGRASNQRVEFTKL